MPLVDDPPEFGKNGLHCEKARQIAKTAADAEGRLRARPAFDSTTQAKTEIGHGTRTITRGRRASPSLTGER